MGLGIGADVVLFLGVVMVFGVSLMLLNLC